jgi:hypothetical protein
MRWYQYGIHTIKGFDNDLTEAMLSKASMYNMLTDHCIEDRSIARYVATNTTVPQARERLLVYSGVYYSKSSKRMICSS